MYTGIEFYINSAIFSFYQVFYEASNLLDSKLSVKMHLCTFCFVIIVEIAVVLHL